MDIDEFKQINDTYGHAVGDQVLTEMARRLKSTVRDTDMILRWGGEEFLIFSPKANAAQITRLVDRVLRAVGGTCFDIGNLKIRVTVTAGFIALPFSGIPETECDWEKTLQIADMALFLGKAHGRNRAYGLGKLLVTKEQALPMLETDLAAAIAANMVEVIELIGPTESEAGNPVASIDAK
jgi:diguanylate cyclase (GGDEF)-like protein